MNIRRTMSLLVLTFLSAALCVTETSAAPPPDEDTYRACGLSHGEFTGAITVHPLNWSELKRPLCVLEIRPEQPPKQGEKWPVVVLLHGLRGAPADWLRFAQIHRRIQEVQKEGSMPPAVFLIPTGYNGYWTNWVDGKHPYRDLVFAYLRDAEARTPHLSKDPAQRAIAGYSMGGFGALSIALDHPEEIGIAIGMSPTDLVIATEQQPNRKVYQRIFGNPIDPGAVRAVNPRNRIEDGKGRDQVFRLFVGTSEGAKFTRGTRELNAAMHRRNLQVDLTEIPNGTHGWETTWAADVQRDWLRQLGYQFRSHAQPTRVTPGNNPVQQALQRWQKGLETRKNETSNHSMVPE